MKSKFITEILAHKLSLNTDNLIYLHIKLLTLLDKENNNGMQVNHTYFVELQSTRS